MKFKQSLTKILGVVLSLLLMLVCPTTVFAEDSNISKSIITEAGVHDPIAEVKYVSTNSIIAFANVNRRTISADVTIKAMNANTPSDGSISIQKSEKGAWKTVTKWRFAEKGSKNISKKYSGKRGTYRVYVSGKVGNDRINSYSNTVTIK